MGSLAELTKVYLSACEVEGKSPRTIRGYRETLRRFAEVVASHELPADVETFTVQDVYAYLAALRERNISRAYQHRLHREVKAFFSWCKRLDVVQDNVFTRVPIVKLEQQIIQPFSPDEIRALLAAINLRRRPGIRNYALVLFLLATGVRASECVSVRLDDVDWERGRVRVCMARDKSSAGSALARTLSEPYRSTSARCGAWTRDRSSCRRNRVSASGRSY